MHKITIEANEIEHLLHVSLLRASTNRMNGKQGLTIIKSLQGCIGELAFAKFFNFYPDFTWETRKHTGTSSKWYDFKLNNGKTFDVKTSQRNSFSINRNATTYKYQPDYFIFVQTPLIDLDKPISDQEAIIHGYSTLKQVVNCRIDTNGFSPCYIVRGSNIKPLTKKQYA